ncbi:hypothetical protein [Flavobacterium sp.]|uniref:hypothetical protein n=1 Tax=Flavobacterium sp. TaxID=239 RepID=UPI00262B0532|nr:hypothetical protein [Flavobacterium sp.]
MINLKTFKKILTNGFKTPGNQDESDGRNTKNVSTLKFESLAYLAYKNQNAKDVKTPDANEFPKVYFGDEWAF